MGFRHRQLKIKKIELLYFLLLIPFFKLLSLGMFQEHGFQTSFFRALENITDVLRVLAALMGYLLSVKSMFKKKWLSKTGKWLIIMFAAQAMSCLLNRSIGWFFTVKAFSYIGFVLLCNWINEYSVERGLHVDRFFFKWLTIFGVISIFIFPLGFLHADRVYTAVYFLGGKNAAFPFYYLFLLSWYLLSMMKQKKLPHFWYIPLIVMILAAVVCQSVSTLITLILVGLVCVLYLRIRPKIRIGVLFAALGTILGAIYIGVSMPAISRLLLLFGRNSTFSHRTILWKQAAYYIAASPIYGGVQPDIQYMG